MALRLFLPAPAESDPGMGGISAVVPSKGPEIATAAPGGAEQATGCRAAT